MDKPINNHPPVYSQPGYNQPSYPQNYGQTYPQDYGQQYGQSYPQTYGQPAYPPEPYSPPNVQQNYGSAPPTYHDVYGETKFPDKPKYQDAWAAILFIVHLGVLGFLFVVGLISFNKSEDKNGDRELQTSNTHDLGRGAVICGAAAILAAFLSGLWLYLCRKEPKALIYFSIIGNLVLLAAMCVYSFAVRQVVGGIFLVIAIILFVFIFLSIRSRIPFAAAILSHVASVLGRYPGVFFVSIVVLVLEFVFLVFWLATLFLDAAFPRGAFYAAAVFLTFSFYWTLQVLKNTTHVITSGTFATDYFFFGSPSGMPENPTMSSTKRALTYSFGSVCYGSLIVALLQTARSLLRSFADRNSDNFVVVILACIIDCILAWIESLLRYFNLYAFTHVAVYGKAYCEAAKDTWDLFKSAGFEAIANDNLIGTVITVTSFLTAIACAIFGGALGAIFVNDIWPLTCVISFFIGFAICMVPLSLIQSGVCTVFVCFAEQPEILKFNNPDLHQKFMETYSHV
jgi:hypothetical protein